MWLREQKLFNFRPVIDTCNEMAAHMGSEKRTRFRNNPSKASWSGRVGPPVHHGCRLYGQKETFFAP